MMSQIDLYAEQRVANEKPSAIIAYALWFFLGYFGVHRFYLGRWGTGLAMLLLFGIGTLTAPVLIGWVPLVILALWWVIDLVLISGIIREKSAEIRYRAYAEARG